LNLRTVELCLTECNVRYELKTFESRIYICPHSMTQSFCVDLGFQVYWVQTGLHSVTCKISCLTKSRLLQS